MTYPKDGERKLREENKQLRMQVSRLRKENETMRMELQHVMKPVRPRKENLEKQNARELSHEEWRQDFVKRFRPKLSKGSGENKDGNEEK